VGRDVRRVGDRIQVHGVITAQRVNLRLHEQAILQYPGQGRGRRTTGRQHEGPVTVSQPQAVGCVTHVRAPG
jgi:hypothetical protein